MSVVPPALVVVGLLLPRHAAMRHWVGPGLAVFGAVFFLYELLWLRSPPRTGRLRLATWSVA